MLGTVATAAKITAGVLAFAAAMLVYQAAPASPEPLTPGRESAALCSLRRSELAIQVESEEWRREQMRRNLPNCAPLPQPTWDRADLQRAGLFGGGALAALMLAAFATNAERRHRR